MNRGVIVAGIGALLLLFVMAVDWYSTATGDEARRVESLTDNPSGAESGEIDRRLNEEARFVAEGQEKNAWQADALIDRILIGFLVASIVLALITWFTRALGGRAPTKGIGPAGLTAITATIAAILVAYRIIQEPGLDEATHVKAGAPLALIPLGMIALGASAAMRADDEAKEEADVAGAD